MRIDNQLPGGNVIVQQIDGHNALLKRELRDTAGNWFYWKFRAEFDEPGDYAFTFLEGASIGNRGAAVSVDKGKTWTWGGVSEADKKAETFRHHAATAGEVWFCVCVPYMQSDWDEFMASMPEGTFHCEELCRSRKGLLRQIPQNMWILFCCRRIPRRKRLRALSSSDKKQVPVLLCRRCNSSFCSFRLR